MQTDARLAQSRLLLLNYAAAIFTSAFLLFQVQPLISKHILPWFGGGAAVWTTCLLFFQSLLFVGYAYAHIIHTHLAPRKQVLLHLGLVLAALAAGRILPSATWEPRGTEDPVFAILLILLVSVGLPYFVLSATGPLLQAWFARTFPGRSPYKLYALSNLGSLLALLSYPFIVEPAFSLPQQAAFWQIGFLIYAALCSYAAWRLWSLCSRLSPRDESAPRTSRQKRNENRDATRPKQDMPESPTGAPANDFPTITQRFLWLLYSMAASIVLMATTNHISTDIAVMPFLWIAPLALYLVTFIIAFDRPNWYLRVPLAVIMLVSVYATSLIHRLNVGWSNFYDAGTPGLVYSSLVMFVRPMAMSPEFYISTLAFLIVNLITMFVLCLMCHGELFRQRPDPKYLTSFYLMISLGGALGGFVVTFIAPQLFATYYEWELSLYIATVVAIGILLRALVNQLFIETTKARRPVWQYAGLAALVLGVFLPSAVLLLDLVDFLQPSDAGAALQARNFYGTLSVVELDKESPPIHRYLLRHGRITHGGQLIDFHHGVPVTYYARGTGVARAIDYYRRELTDQQMRVGVVGLGIGTMAAYVDGGDAVTFYEINPNVRKIAENGQWFTFLKDCRARGAHVDVRLGDARLTLKRELIPDRSPPLGGEGLGEGGSPPANNATSAANPTGNNYNVIVLDAFSGDSIPVHLLTVEAFELYLKHLAHSQKSDDVAVASATVASPITAHTEEGAILVHASNRYLRLAPVVYGIAKHFKLHAVRIRNYEDKRRVLFAADWIILTRNEKLAQELAHFGTDKIPANTILWTDAHSSLFQVMK